MTETIGRRPIAALVAGELISALKLMGQGVLEHYHMDAGFDRRLRESEIADFKRENPGKVVTAEEALAPS